MQTYRQLNPPIYRASTILFDTVDQFLARSNYLYDGYTYGVGGTPTMRELETVVADIEGGTRSLVVPSGLAALTHSLLAFCKAGDHVLVVDCTYSGNRDFCQTTLSDINIDVELIPSSANTIASSLRPETRLVVLESPGYYTMEIQDIDSITREAHNAGALVLIDNSWGFGFSKMFEHGVDISCVALSKYASGAGDLCLGAITVKDEGLFKSLKRFLYNIGAAVSSEDAYLVLRSLPSLQTRVHEHARRAQEVSKYLAALPGVEVVLNPVIPSAPYHERFKKYFSSGNGLFSVKFKDCSLSNLRKMIDSFSLIRIGASWGSAHSLVSITRPASSRTIDEHPQDNYLVRFHIGLENFQCIMEDIKKGIKLLNQG